MNVESNIVWCCVSIALCVHCKGDERWSHILWMDRKQNPTGNISNAIFLFYSFKTEERKISHDGTLKLDELHVSHAISHQNDGKWNKLDSRGKYILVYIVIERLLANSVEWLNHWIDTNFTWSILKCWFSDFDCDSIKSNPIKHHLAMEWISGICNLLSIAVRNSQCNQLNLLDEHVFQI